MANACVEKMGHSCGSTSGLQVFEKEPGVFDGYCFSCSTYVPDPYENKPKDYRPVYHKKTETEIQEELESITEYPVAALADRKLCIETVDYFGVHVGVSESDGQTPVSHYYPYYKNNKLSAYKVRIIEGKRIWSMGDMKDVDLFGWDQAMSTGAKRLIITEGEIDAMSLWQMIKDSNRNGKYADFNPAVVSIPNGAAAAANVLTKKMADIMKTFKEVVFVPDQDEAGLAAAEEVAKQCPGVMIATLPDKDANDCLLNGKSKAAISAVMWNAQQAKNTRLLRGSSLREKAMKEPEMGLDWPWPALTEATRGRRRGETLYFGAGVKMGKSEVVNAIAAHIIETEGSPVLLVKPEEDPAKTYKMLVGKVAHRIFHDPKIAFDKEAFLKAEKKVGDLAIILDSYQFVKWDTLKDDIRYAVTHEGVKDVILDPITCFTNEMDASAANNFLVNMTAELSAMARDLDFTVYIFCHLKAPLAGEPHERGGKVLSTQFAGSRAMMRSCNYMIGFQGNKDPELPDEERNIRQLVILEDREFGTSETIPLYWDKHTGVFSQLEA